MDLDCSSDSGSRTCFTKEDRYNVVTRQEPAALSASSTCADNAQRNHSWVLEGFSRHYEQPSTETTETALSFTLKSRSTSDVFNCTLAGAQKVGEGQWFMHLFFRKQFDGKVPVRLSAGIYDHNTELELW